MDSTVSLQENGSARKRPENVLQSPLIPSVGQNRNGSSAVIVTNNQIDQRVTWADWETTYFIRLVINSSYANRRKELSFYSSLIAPLAAVGIKRNALQLRSKWEKLKQYYTRRMARYSDGKKQWTSKKKYYHLLHKAFHLKLKSNDAAYLCQAILNSPPQIEMSINSNTNNEYDSLTSETDLHYYHPDCDSAF